MNESLNGETYTTEKIYVFLKFFLTFRYIAGSFTQSQAAADDKLIVGSVSNFKATDIMSSFNKSVLDDLEKVNVIQLN